MDAGTVNRTRHRAAERVNLLREMPFANATDSRVATHLAERVEVLSQQQRLCACASSRESGLGASVATTNDDTIE
jgi:hypothetical protein